KIQLDGQSVDVPVQVTGQKDKYEVSFIRDVMPTLSRMGCNLGTCHGAETGKGGFKLSLRGYDPLFDHRALTDDLSGRRFDRAAVVTAVRRGEATITARYEGAYAAATLIVMGDRTGFVWKTTPEYNWIDTLVYDKLKQVKILPADVCTDSEFIRRVYLDLT